MQCELADVADVCEPSWVPTAEEVVFASRTLYEDEIKPVGRILMKRLREIAARAAGSDNNDAVPLVDPLQLRAVCEASDDIIVEAAEGREFFALLHGEKSCFVDACCPVDPYPARMWEQAAAFFEGLDDHAGHFPCGRYACALELQSRSVPFLAGRSLGEACHIVQLAISVKMLLGYADGSLVPYARSEKYTKARNAVRQQPMEGSRQQDAAPLPYATWEDVVRGLPLLLQRSRKPSPGVVTVSNIKRLFRSDLHLELSETALGHSRVWEMLRDARLHGVCHVSLASHGQALVQLLPRMPAAASTPLAPVMPPAPMYQPTLPQAAWRTVTHPAPPSAPPAAAVLSTCASTRRPVCAPLLPPPAPAPAPLLATAPSPPAVHTFGVGTRCNAPTFEAWVGKAATEEEIAESCDTGSCVSSADFRPTISSGSYASSSQLASPRCDSEAAASTMEEFPVFAVGGAGDDEALCGLSPAFRAHGFVVRNTFIQLAPKKACVARRRCASLPRVARLVRELGL